MNVTADEIIARNRANGNRVQANGNVLQLPVPPPPLPVVVRLSEVEPEQVEWLWNPWLPLGKLVMLDGDPGMGKSTVAVDIGARVTTGSLMPDGSPGVKGAVLILSAEDGLADTIRPRIDAAGGDAGQVFTISEIVTVTPAGERAGLPVSLPADLPHIEQVVNDHGVVLIVIDVLMAYLAGEVNAYRDQDVRRVLHAAKEMAERTSCCVVMLRHFNKAAGASAVYRGGGSIGVGGAARAVLMCGPDPEDESGARRLLAPVKLNLAEEPQALMYRLVGDDARGCASVQWEGASPVKAAAILAGSGDDEERAERGEAAEWLEAYLISHGGQAVPADIKKAARADGIAVRTLERARPKVADLDRSGFPARSLWVLKTTVPPAVSPQSRQFRHAPGDGEAGETVARQGGE